MAEIETGGQAFPLENAGTEFQAGMTLRDHFAGLAMQGFAQVSMSADWPYSPDAMAKEAYSWADAMLIARARSNE